MEYYDSNNRLPRRCGLIATAAYLMIVALLMLFARFTYEVELPPDEGILVEFGDSDMGFGEEELLATDTASPPPPTAVEEIEEQVESDDNSEVEIEAPAEQEPAPKTPQVAEPQPTPPDSVVQEQRVVNQKALFPGRKEDSKATSSGKTEGTKGNQGAESGGDEGAAEGGGTGLNGPMVELHNRSLVGKLPKPAYGANAAGKVVIEITVDETGRVTSARYRATGSTTNNSQLVAAAQKAALKARFNSSDNFVQQGTITYNFKQN